MAKTADSSLGVPDNDDPYLASIIDLPDADPNSPLPELEQRILPKLVNIPGYVCGWIPAKTLLAPENATRTMAAIHDHWRVVKYTEYAQVDPTGASAWRMRVGGQELIQIRDLLAAKIPVQLYNAHRKRDLEKIQQNTRATYGVNKMNSQNPYSKYDGAGNFTTEYKEEHTVVQDGIQRTTKRSSDKQGPQFGDA